MEPARLSRLLCCTKTQKKDDKQVAIRVDKMNVYRVFKVRNTCARFPLVLYKFCILLLHAEYASKARTVSA